MSPRPRRHAALLAVLALLVAACGASPPEPVTATVVTSAPVVSPADLMPANSLGVMHVQLEAIRQSPWFDRAMQQLHEVMPRDRMDAEMRSAEDLFLAIDELAMAMPSREAAPAAPNTPSGSAPPTQASRPAANLMGLVAPVDIPERRPQPQPQPQYHSGPEPFVGFAEGRITPAMINAIVRGELTQTTRNGRPYWGDDEGAIIVLDESHAMMGLPPGQADALESRFDGESPATGPTTPELVAAAERIQFGSHMFQFASLMTRDLRREFSRPFRDQLVTIGAYANLEGDFTGHLFMQTRSADTATALAAEFNEAIAELRGEPEFEMFGASSIIDHLRIAADGEYVTIDLTLTADQIEQVFVAVATGVALFQEASTQQ